LKIPVNWNDFCNYKIRKYAYVSGDIPEKIREGTIDLLDYGAYFCEKKGN